MQPLKGSVTQLTSPAQLASNGFSETIADSVDFILEFGEVRQQLQTLEEENARLKTEVADKIELERENQELKQILGFSVLSSGLQLRGAQVLARVIGQESSNFTLYHTRSRAASGHQGGHACAYAARAGGARRRSARVNFRCLVDPEYQQLCASLFADQLA